MKDRELEVKGAKNKEAVVTLIIITTFTFILYVPFAIYLLVGGIYVTWDFPKNLPGYLYMLRFGSIVNTISFANGGVDSLVYVFRSKKIKDFYKKKYRKLKTKLLGDKKESEA